MVSPISQQLLRVRTSSKPDPQLAEHPFPIPDILARPLRGMADHNAPAQMHHLLNPNTIRIRRSKALGVQNLLPAILWQLLQLGADNMEHPLSLHRRKFGPAQLAAIGNTDHMTQFMPPAQPPQCRNQAVALETGAGLSLPSE